jgi:protein involved in polysaccharide export with SLBB domain
LAVVTAVGLSGCARDNNPLNLDQKLFDPEKTNVALQSGPGLAGHELRRQRSLDSSACPPPGTPLHLEGGRARRSADLRRLTMRYSPGDRFNLQVPGAPEFSGDFAVNADGRVILPYAGEIPAIGLSNAELTTAIERAFIRARLFQPEQFKVAVRPVQYAPINVTVSGAVFSPGRMVIGYVRDGDKNDKALQKFGDNPIERFVAIALRAAGGVRPDADLTDVRLVRRGQVTRLNWLGAITGGPVDDIALLEGDHLEIGEAKCFQSALMRPSQITPSQLKVFMSNLSLPAATNANADLNRINPGLPYGTKLLAAAVAANCVGGSLASNAHRYVVLISRNPKTHRSEVIQRSVEEMVRSPDRDSVNPYLMPDDAIACYDSAITDVREVSNTVQTLLLPGQVLRNGFPRF